MPLDIPASLFATREPQTQSGDSGYAAFVEGQRGARQNRELRLKEDEQTAMLPIKAEQARLVVDSQLLDINLKRNQLERDNQIKAGQSEALQIMLDAGGFEDGYLNPAITQRLHRLAVTNPAVFMSPSGQGLLNNWRGAQVASQAITKAGMTGLPLRSITTDEAGKSVTTFEDPSFRFDPLAQEKLDLRRRGLDQADIRSQLNALGLELRATEQGYKIENMPGVAMPAPAPTPGQPNQPTAKPTLTPIARPLTTANVTANQVTLSTSSIALREIAAVMPLISAETVGPFAAAKSFAVDRGLANIWPDLANLERIEAGSIFTRIRASIIKALRSDSNINKDEVATLEAQVPKVEAFLASPVQAMAQLKSIASGVQERGIQAARQLNQTLPDDMLRSLGDEQMLKYLRDKKLTPEEAERWHGLQP